MTNVNEAEGFEQWVTRKISSIEQLADLLTIRVNDLRSVQEDLAGTDKAVDALNDRLSALENYPRSGQKNDEYARPISAEAIRRLEAPFTAGEGIEVMSLTNTEARDLSLMEKYNEGYVAGQKSMLEQKNALEERVLRGAEQRIRNYMGGYLSAVVMETIIASIRGEIQVEVPAPDASAS